MRSKALKNYRHSIFFCLISIYSFLSHAQSVSVGQIGPFTGLPSPDALHISQGAKAYFDSANASGGVGGKKIDFFTLDDQFNPEVFKKQMTVADEKNAVALISTVGIGSLNVLFAKGELDKHRFLVLNSIPGPQIFRTINHPKVFHIRASDNQQIDKMLKNASTMGIKTMSVLYEDSTAGSAGLNHAVETGSQQKIAVQGFKTKAEPAAMALAADAVIKSAPQSVFIFGPPRFVAQNAVNLRKSGYKGWIFCRGDLSPSLLVQVAGAEGAKGIGIAQIYPNPNGKTLPLQTEFQSVMKEFAPEVKVYSNFHLEGYISARVIAEGIKRTSGTVSAEKLAVALKSIKDWSLGGFRIDFSRSNAASSFVDIGVMSYDGKFIY